ncbi:MAG: nucleotidyltransferase family protein, partial [Chloroflexota bacterium]|nr:nucleotidyltransferase family protein [Chloroflexota bacterium]
MEAIILAGGEGIRLRPLTHNLPKPMLPVLNRPFVEHTTAYLQKNQIGNIVLATSYLSEAIQEYFGQGASQDVKLSYALEDKPLGTAGAVKNTEHHLSDAFFVLNGDIFTDLDLASMLAFHREKGAKVTIALTWVDNPCAYGVVESEGDGRITCFIEKPSHNYITTNWIN